MSYCSIRTLLPLVRGLSCSLPRKLGVLLCSMSSWARLPFPIPQSMAIASWVGLVFCPLPFAWSANVQSAFSYKSSITNDANGPLDLLAELNYDNTRTNAPIAVVMHGYSPASGNFSNVRGNAQRLRDAGFFVLSVAMRGRDGSDGIRDSGGLEIYDIHDAVENAKTSFPSLVDPTNVHITGYSGGGGNVMSALTKFPDYFRLGSSFFGMSDYGFNSQNGWYQNGASSGHQNQLQTDIGNPISGGAPVLDKYLARASNQASHNNPYSEIHLFVNSNETTCPPVNIITYQNNAISNAIVPNEFANIRLHIGNASSPSHEDFNGNTINEPNELQSWPHGFPDANQQAAGESWYLSRLLAGTIPEPALNNSDELFVAGFVRTKRFELRLGDGQNAAGTLNYSLSPTLKQFSLNIESSNTAVTGKLWVDLADMAGESLDVLLNGSFYQSVLGGGNFQFDSLGDDAVLKIAVHKVGDYNRDTLVDLADYEHWRVSFGATGPSAMDCDGNGDGIVDAADYLVWRKAMSSGGAQGASSNHLAATSVPEPTMAYGLGAGVVAALLRNKRSILPRHENTPGQVLVTSSPCSWVSPHPSRFDLIRAFFWKNRIRLSDKWQ